MEFLNKMFSDKDTDKPELQSGSVKNPANQAILDAALGMK